MQDCPPLRHPGLHFSDAQSFAVYIFGSNVLITHLIQEHRFETTKLLLSYGANPWLESRYRDDALQTACLKVDTFSFLQALVI